MKLNWNYPTNIWVGEHRVDDLHEPSTPKPEANSVKILIFFLVSHLI